MNWHRHFSQRVAEMRSSSVRELLKLTSQPGMISFAGGLPDPDLFPVDEVRAATDRVLRRNPTAALQYGQTEGLPELRDWIAACYSRATLHLRRENVMIVSGSQQALDLIGKVFLDPGDSVLVENPTYLAALSAWRPHGARFVAAPSDGMGLQVETLPPLMREGCKLIYVVPDFQNPQGSTLNLSRRRQLANLLHEYDLPLIEDSPYGELRFEGEDLPSLLELDARTGCNGTLRTHIVQLGTFSKVLTPGLRVAWIIAAAEVIEKLVLAKQSADLHTSTLCQHIALEVVRSGLLEHHIPRLRLAYRQKRNAMLQALAEKFSDSAAWTRPAGGMFLLMRLEEKIDSQALLPHALEQRVAFVPGADFHINGDGANTLRLNFSHPKLDEIPEGLRRLRVAMRNCVERWNKAPSEASLATVSRFQP